MLETIEDGEESIIENGVNKYITLDSVKNHKNDLDMEIQSRILYVVLQNLPNVFINSEDNDFFDVAVFSSDMFDKKEFKKFSKLTVNELKKRKFKVKLIYDIEKNIIRIYGW